MSKIVRFMQTTTLQDSIHGILAFTMLLLTAIAAGTPVCAQTLNFSTPERDSTTPMGGESGRTGVGAANFNNQLWVAYAGASTIDDKGDAYIYVANNSDGGINYSNKTQVTFKYEQPAATNANPALAVFNGQLYLAWNDGYGNCYFAASPDGYNWGNTFYSCQTGTDFVIDASPSMAVFGQNLYIGLRDDTTHAMIISQVSPSNASAVTEYSSITLNFNPGLGVFNGMLYAAIESQDNSHTIYFYTSQDGGTWALQTGASQDQTSTAPTLAVHNGILYMGFRSNDSRDLFLYKYSTDGFNFSNSIRANTAVAGNPQLLEATQLTGSPYQGQLYLYWSSNSSPQYLCSDHAQ